MPRYSNDVVSFEAQLKNETAHCWLLVIDGDDFWIPKSISTWHQRINKVDGTIEMPTWKAEELGLA